MDILFIKILKFDNSKKGYIAYYSELHKIILYFLDVKDKVAKNNDFDVFLHKTYKI